MNDIPQETLDIITSIAKKHAYGFRAFAIQKSYGVFSEEDLLQEGVLAGIEHYISKDKNIDCAPDNFFGPTIYYAIKQYLVTNQGLLFHGSSWRAFAKNIEKISSQRQGALVIAYDDKQTLEIPDPSGLSPVQEVEIKDWLSILTDEEKMLIQSRLIANNSLKKAEIIKELQLDKNVQSASAYNKLQAIDRSIIKKYERRYKN